MSAPVARFRPEHFIQAPNGVVTAIDYLPFGQLSGSSEHGNERGYLSRIRVMRDRSVSAGNGPTTVPCPNLPGPYRWLLPAGCGSGGLVDQLKTQAGLSDGVAQEIVRQATTTELAASITRFQYSVIGAPSTVFQSDGSEVRLTRDVDGRVREEQLFETATQLHSRTVHTRNLQGHATRIERFNRSGASLGATIQMWDEEGNLRFRCIEAMANGCSGVAHAAVPPGNPLGGTSESFWYDREGRLILEMDPEVAYTEYQLDERGWVTGISQTFPGAPPTIPAEIGRHTRFVLNDDGQWTERSQHQLATPLPPFITRELRSFDGFGRVTSVTDSEGKVSVVRHTRQDALSSVSTASAWTVQYVRDHFSRVRERRLNGQTTVTVFRLPGGQVFRRNVTGAVERFLTYDEFGAPVFERQGPVTTVQVKPADRRYRGGSTVRLETRLATTSTEQTLDALGEVLSEVETGFDGTSTPPTRSSSFLRDDNGFLRQTTDSLGAVSEFVPNFLGWVGTQIVTVNPGVTRTTSFTYNRRGQLLTRSDPRGGQPQTVQTYTGYGEPKTRTVPGGTTAAPNDMTASWQYDEVGRLTREQMGTAVVRYQYANDRLSQVTADNGTTVLRSFGYDTLGRISSATHFNVGLTPWVAANQRTVVATRTYDPVYGRLATESTKVGNRPTRTTSSAWSLVSDRWRRTVTRPDGLTSVENFDGLGRLGTMQRAFGGLKSQYTYTGELEEVEDHQTTGASFGRQVTWDGMGQLQRSTYSQGGIVSDVRYQRDREGRIVSQNRLLRQGTTQERTFRGYKYQQGGALEQLIEAVGNATPSGAATDTTWASVQAAGASLSGQRFEYTRDVEGSPLRVLRVDVGSQTPRFTSPTRRRGFQMESFTLNGSAAQTVTHDTAGRMTQEFGRTYVWDDFHSLVRAWVPSGSNEQAFQYDAFGRLVAVRRGTTNWPIDEELAYDGTQMVAAWNFEETQLWNAQWGQGVDNLVSVRMGTTGTEAFALKDGRGNVTGYYRGQGSTPGLWVTAEYTPEGRVTQKDWTTSGTCTETGLTKCPRMGGVPFGFHSAYKSPAHGLLYFRNRWYSAEAGQWLSQDPLGEVDSANLYAFNGFDSVNFIDPFGLESEGPAVQTEPGGQCKSNEQGCKPGPGEVNYVTERPKFDPFLIQNAHCQFANNCLTNNLAKLDGQVNGPRQPATPEEPTKAPGPTLTRLRQGVRTALEFVAVKDQLLAKIVGSPSGANIGPDVGSKMGKLMDEGVSLQEAIKTSLNMTLNPTWPVLEHSSAASDAASNGQTGRFVFHAVAAVVSTVALVGMVSGVGSSGGGGAPVRGFHGTTRANVLGILNKGGFIPKNGQVWLSRLLGDTFQHGGDKAAGAAFAIEVELAAGVAGESVSVPGNPFSIVVKGTGLVQGTVKTLFVRTKDGEGGFQTQVISGQAAIRSFLEK